MENVHSTSFANFQSPIGNIVIIAHGNSLTSVTFADAGDTRESNICNEAVQQLREYFSFKRNIFTLSLNFEGSAFRVASWRYLQDIPYGQTRSYKQQAIAVGNKLASRAVAQANHHNQFAIIVPCHRIIASNGKLGGYGAGVWRKEWLLNHERSFSAA